jgi:hypothetical protein
MKCIQCQTDNNLQERTENQGRCKNCGHPFAFEPTSMGRPWFTDAFFAKAIADISANGTLFFTPNQFLYFLDRRLRSRFGSGSYGCFLFLYIFYMGFAITFGGLSLSTLLILLNFYLNLNINLYFSFLMAFVLFHALALYYILVKTKSAKQNYQDRKKKSKALIFLGLLIIILAFWVTMGILNSFIAFSTFVILGMTSIYLGSRQLKRQPKIRQSFFVYPTRVQDWLNRWIEINGNSEKMLPSPPEENTEAEISPDISAYSFDRVVVCDSATIAQLLIANNFHFENNCAVLSINGYPQRIFRTVLQMLKRNPELKVYALHDSSPRGVRLLHHLRTSQNWFAESTVTIYDLGLLPRHILNSKRNFFVRGSAESAQQAKQLPPDVRHNLSAEELEWLELGNFVELESLTPRRLLQIVSQGIARRQLSPNGTDSAFVEIDSDSSSGDAYLLASESFG